MYNMLTNWIKTLCFLGVRIGGKRREIVHVFVQYPYSVFLLSCSDGCRYRRARAWFGQRIRTSRSPDVPSYELYDLILNCLNPEFPIPEMT